MTSLLKYNQLISRIFFSFFIGGLLLSQHGCDLIQSFARNGSLNGRQDGKSAVSLIKFSLDALQNRVVFKHGQRPLDLSIFGLAGRMA